MSIVTRFAPSPTGPLHLGHAYSALIAHDMARKHGGQFLLRFEDTDLERSKPEYIAQILDDLTWIGITWDGDPLFQSAHLDVYNQELDRLISRDLTYPCRCSRKDIAAASAAPQEGVPHHLYPQTCKHRLMSDRQAGDAIRLHMDRACVALDGEMLSYCELGNINKGTYYIDFDTLLRDVGDIVIGRKDIQTAAYFMASAIDDIRQGITHVVRGVDLFEFTQVQVLLLHLLGHKAPLYHHHGLIRDESGKRLAKRDDARAISKYRSEGASVNDIKEMVGVL
ncbi:glutamyl-Q tRNA(Asp) synthetase [Pacificibacter maritimus]|uniref:Glutamyl-Q tRNA(Asp) synthetase n=1 Tax=Pacificibacter maritimus TaxID=762213 RepID=A0A3N4ULG8_9RHOB|nr:tRNA glutamyl-Q(34) synthetase GluQRS [Pacificibacter maritimus]RPE71486.1 glutamyl-Q tRNA(Asp) synthetase [Pacificibacter maritimus]